MKDILIFDAHIDTPRLFIDEAYRLADRHSYYELDLPRIREDTSGRSCSVSTRSRRILLPRNGLPRALEVIDALHEEVRSKPKKWSSPIRAATSSVFTKPANSLRSLVSKAVT